MNSMESYEAEEFGRYTSLSSLAVCAFVLGLASLVALLAPLMVIVPIAGFIMSALALVRINRSEGAISGRNLALSGLALSIACGIASPLRVSVRDGLYARQADQAGRVWLALVSKNQTQAALKQLTGNAKVNLLEPPASDGPPPKVDPQMQVAKLGQSELVTTLRDEAQHAELEFATRSLATDASGPVPRAAITYQTTEPDDSLTMNLVLLKSVTDGNWLVDSWSLAGEAEHGHVH